MSDIFKLFDGKFGAGGASAVSNQNASSFSDVVPENDLVARLASGSDSVDLLIDYSDFANFVTFNSAESYVTITADQILNDYPLGGTADDLQAFMMSLDGYQRYFLSLWPSRIGHLRLTPAVSSSYVRIDDFGVLDGVAKSSFMSPGTGSFSIQGWLDVPALTGSDDVQVVFQKQLDATHGYSVFVSGSYAFFQIISGSSTTTVSGALSVMPSFFSAVCDRSSATGTVSLYIATTGTFPTLIDSTALGFATRFDLASGSFYIGSGSIATKVVRPFTGSLDDISVWSSVRALAAITSSFNRKVFAQPGLLGAWRFNEATSQTPSTVSSIARDCSGHRLDGRIQNYFSGSRGSGSFAYDSPDPILSLDDPNVVSYILTEQTAGSSYDRNNQSLIFNLFPSTFLQQDQASVDVFQNFALIIARHFDRIKIYIDQLKNLRIVKYGEFDQTPDELLGEVAKFFGWNLHGNFINADASRYLIGRDVTAGPQGNAGLDITPSNIQSQFWRRVLLNMMYMYKTKGTRESIEAVLRTYGANNGFVRLKEYARKSEARVPTQRIIAEKSVYSLTFGANGNLTRVESEIAQADDGAIDGDLAITMGAVTDASDGTVLVAGVAAITLGAITVSSDGSSLLVSIAVSPSPGVLIS